MPKVGQAFRRAARLDALAPASCIWHGGEPSIAACSHCMNERAAELLPILRAHGLDADAARLQSDLDRAAVARRNALRQMEAR